MDKGWSWVIMVMAFGVHFSCGGIQNTAGFIRYNLLQNADENETRYITWITSIYSGMINVVAPIASVLVYKYGCRASVIVGAALETLGFIISYLVRDKWVYFISYSFISAVGSGLTYTTVLVLLNFNFKRYLSMASGIACSGQGFGLVFMPIITNSLFERYGLQGMFLLLGGITMQKCLFGALMRPSTVELDQISKFAKSKTRKNQQYPQNIQEPTELTESTSPEAETDNANIEELSAVGSNHIFESTEENSSQNSETSSDIVKENVSGKTGQQIQVQVEFCCPGYIPDVLGKEECEEAGKNEYFQPILAAESELGAKAKDWSDHVGSGKENMGYDSDEEEDKVATNIQNDKQTVNIDRQAEINASSFTAGENNTSNSTIIVENHSSKCSRTENKMSDLHALTDVISDENETNEYKMAAENNAPEKTDVTFDENEESHPGQASNSVGNNRNPYLKVLKNRKFLFLLYGIIFFSVPEDIIYIMFPKYFVDNGSNGSEVTYLLSILGISSTISRFLMGILANSQIIDIYVLFSAPFGILGVVTLLLPFYVQTFTGRLLFVILFGLYNSSVYSLLNQVILRITGIDNLTAAFGFVILIKGTVEIFGPPMADAIASAAQDSDASFYLAGCMYIMCLLSMVLLADKDEKCVRNDNK